MTVEVAVTVPERTLWTDNVATTAVADVDMVSSGVVWATDRLPALVDDVEKIVAASGMSADRKPVTVEVDAIVADRALAGL